MHRQRFNAGMGQRVRSCALAGIAVLLVSHLAAAQETTSPEADPAEAAPKQPGVFESIGRWFDQGAADFRAHMQGAKERMDDLNNHAATQSKSAVDAMVKLPNTRVISGRERCAVAANGAPDCQAAADALCRKQGFSSGRSMDFTSAEQCPARVWLSGRQSTEDCTTVTFISRAMCQ